MRIYYFGELIEDTKSPKQKEIIEKNILSQTALLLEEAQPESAKPKPGMPPLGDLLQDIDMSLDAALPFRFRSGTSSSLLALK